VDQLGRLVLLGLERLPAVLAVRSMTSAGPAVRRRRLELLLVVLAVRPLRLVVLAEIRLLLELTQAVRVAIPD
jgi:hypothetical protein